MNDRGSRTRITLGVGMGEGGGRREEAKAVLSCNVRCRGRQVRRVKICTGGIGMGPFDLLCVCFSLVPRDVDPEEDRGLAHAVVRKAGP